MNSNTKRILLWIIRILLALGFLLASQGKLSQNPQVIEMFREWGYPDGFYLIIGIIEFAGAILMLIPKTTYHTSIALFILMIGASFTHIFNDPLIELIRPIIFMLLLGLNVFLSRKS